MWRTVGWLLVAAALAGCADEPAAPAATTEGSTAPGPGPSVPAPDPNGTLPVFDPSINAAFGASGCHGGRVWIPVDRGTAQGLLPAGYVAGSAADLVGPLGSADSAVAALEVVACSASELVGQDLRLGSVSIFVERPEFSQPVDGVDTDWYLVGLYSPHQALADLLVPVDATHALGDVTHEVLSIPAGPATSDAAAGDAEGAVYEFQVYGAVAQRQVSFSKRYWQEAAGGTVWIDYRVRADEIQGVPTCTVRAETSAADLVGPESCDLQRVPLGYVWNDMEWDGLLRYAPGEFASGPSD